MKVNLLALALGALAASVGPAQAEAITDNAWDFLPTYAAGPKNPDLDVVASDVVLDTADQTLKFVGVHDGDIGQTPGALYVWGLDRGQGTERFLAGDPPIGPGVFFDSVVVLRPDGTGLYNDFINGVVTNFDAGDVLIDGPTIATAPLPLSLFPSTGFAPEDYTWNLWPRVGLGQNDQISDFAPNASNVPVSVVPEPASVALLAIGALAASRQRR